MKKIIISIIANIIAIIPIVSIYATWNNATWSICSWGITLNTDVPWVWRCMPTDTTQAFPLLIWWLIKTLTSVMLVIGLIMIIIWWVMMTMDWMNSGSFKKWKDMILKVGTIIALLWLSGVILKAINPNFFM